MNNVRIGFPFIELKEVGSTNDYAAQQAASENIKEGTAWAAYFQKNGKGQRGKSWFAAPGDNINLSVLLRPALLKPSESFILNALIALAVYDFYKNYAGEETVIKWSNDIYWRDKKAGGILIENQIRGQQWIHAVVGIGINLNQLVFPEDLPNPVSLRQITGSTWNAMDMAKLLCQYISARYNALDIHHTDRLIEEYESHLFRLREPALYCMEDEVFEGSILGVEKNGRLILQKANRILRIGFGEIRFVL